MNSRLQQYGPWAVVTGASDGIGKAIADELAAAGLNLVLIARRESLLNQQAEQLRNKHQIDVKVVSADFSEQGTVKKLDDSIQNLDIGLLVAAAGYGTSGDFIDSDIQNELTMVDVNCRAVVEQCHYFARRFKTRSRSGMILFSSILAFQGVPRSANYAATKAFIQSFAEGIHHELKSVNIDVLAAAYGPVKSGFAERADMVMSMSQSPTSVAKATLAAFGKTVTARPGPISKLLGYPLALLPRWLRVRVLANILSDMTKHQTTSNA